MAAPREAPPPFTPPGSGAAAPPRTLAELYASKKWHPLAGHDLRAAAEANYTWDTYLTPSMRAQGARCGCGPFWEDPCRREFRLRLIESMNTADVDVVIYPTWTHPPLRIGDLGDGYFDGNVSPMVAPQAGAPALSVPMGFIDGGLPAGLQLLARPFDEPTLLRMGYAYEQATRHRQPPPLFKECVDEPPPPPPGSKPAG